MVASMNIHNVTSIKKTSKIIQVNGQGDITVYDYTFNFKDNQGAGQSIVITAFLEPMEADE